MQKEWVKQRWGTNNEARMEEKETDGNWDPSHAWSPQTFQPLMMAMMRRFVKRILNSPMYVFHPQPVVFSALTLLVVRNKYIRPVKNDWLWSARCHFHFIISWFIKIPNFLVPAWPGFPVKEAVKWVLCPSTKKRTSLFPQLLLQHFTSPGKSSHHHEWNDNNCQ